MNAVVLNPLSQESNAACRREFTALQRCQPLIRGSSLAAFVLLLAGCAGMPADYGRKEVDQLLQARGAPTESPGGVLLASLIADPISPENAVRIALINNHDLQSTYATLGFGAADVYEAGRIRNPVIGAAVLNSSVSTDRNQVTLGLAMSFTDLITLPARKRLALASFTALQQSVGAEVLAVAAQTENAYYNYVAAQQVATLRAQIAKAGAISAALASRYRDAGNITSRELAMERAAASQTRLASLEAKAHALAARVELANIFGLSVSGTWQIPAKLQLPVKQEDDLGRLVELAKEMRLDLASAHARANVQADRLGVVNWTRWLGDLEVGYEQERETDGARLTGPSLQWEIPIFNQHEDARVRADVQLQIALNDVRRVTIDVENSVRLSRAAVGNARERIAEYRDVLIPQRIESVAFAQQEVNYMLIGIFELIALKQEEYDTYQGYLESIRDYWLARTSLELAVGSALPSSTEANRPSIDIEQFIHPAAGGMDHSMHGSMSSAPSMNKMKNIGSMPTDHSSHMKLDKTAQPNHTQHQNHGNGGSQ